MSSIRRSVQVMELLARKGPQGVRPVAQQLGLPLGSVHRLLLDLEAEGVAGVRWWTPDELAASSERFAPPDLPARVRTLTA